MSVNKGVELIDEMSKYKFLLNHVIISNVYNSTNLKIARDAGKKIKEIRDKLEKL